MRTKGRREHDAQQTCLQGCVLDVGEALGVFERRGSYYYLEGERVAQGRDNAIEILKTNSTILAQAEESIQAAMNPQLPVE